VLPVLTSRTVVEWEWEALARPPSGEWGSQRARLRTSSGDRRCMRAAGRHAGPAASGVTPLHDSHYTAASPVSPVRMRIDSSIGSTKTLPSPIDPVLAAPTIVDTTLSTT